MVRVTIGAGLVEGKDDVRAKHADKRNGGLHEYLLRLALEFAVAEVETADVLHAERPAGVRDFGGAMIAKRAAAGQGGVANLTGLAASKRDDHSFSAAGDVLGQRPADTERSRRRGGQRCRAAAAAGSSLHAGYCSGTTRT